MTDRTWSPGSGGRQRVHGLDDNWPYRTRISCSSIESVAKRLSRTLTGDPARHQIQFLADEDDALCGAGGAVLAVLARFEFSIRFA
jgi:hypothetical protein